MFPQTPKHILFVVTFSFRIGTEWCNFGFHRIRRVHGWTHWKHRQPEPVSQGDFHCGILYCERRHRNTPRLYKRKCLADAGCWSENAKREASWVAVANSHGTAIWLQRPRPFSACCCATRGSGVVVLVASHLWGGGGLRFVGSKTCWVHQELSRGSNQNNNRRTLQEAVNEPRVVHSCWKSRWRQTTVSDVSSSCLFQNIPFEIDDDVEVVPTPGMFPMAVAVIVSNTQIGKVAFAGE